VDPNEETQMKHPGTVVAILLMVGLIACGQGDVPSQPSALGLPSHDEIEKVPANPGNSGVFRFEDVLITNSTDPGRDLIAWHIFAENWTGCGGTENFPLADVQTIETPSGAVHWVGVHSEIPVYIYRLSEWNALGNAEICDFLANDWLYRGTHTMRATANDVTQAGHGASTFGWSAHGVVEDPAGTVYRYTEQQRAIFDQRTGNAKWMTENIRVHRIGR
jgi:hypothetical protein